MSHIADLASRTHTYIQEIGTNRFQFLASYVLNPRTMQSKKFKFGRSYWNMLRRVLEFLESSGGSGGSLGPCGFI